MTDKPTADAPRATGSKRLPPGRPVALPAVPSSPRYSIADLQAETGINGRTIRYYISEGMLTPAHGRGPSATYDKDHLLRLRMIKELKEAHEPLDAIKSKLLTLATEDLEAHFSIRTGPVESSWRRIIFSADLELQVKFREPRDYRFERAVDRIVQHARLVLDAYEENQ